MQLFYFFIKLFREIYKIVCGMLASLANNTIGKYAGTTYEGSTILLFIVVGAIAGFGCWKLVNRSDFR